MATNQKTLMISTCGTSLLTNQAEKPIAAILRATANLCVHELTPEQKQAIDERLQACRKILQLSGSAGAREMSAELNGLLAYYGDNFSGAEQHLHFLLHTDTYQGNKVADVLEEYLKRNGVNVSPLTFSDLRADTVDNFQRGVTEVISWCANTLPGYRKSGYRAVFNLTGGFKSIQGWMQTLGMFYADEIVYIFESSRELLHIPRIPVALDEGARKVLEANLGLFRRLAPKGATCPVDALANIEDVFFYRVGDEAELSVWGRLVWEEFRKEMYSRKLCEPPAENIVFSDKFRREAGRLPADRLAHVNERVDDLDQFLGDRTKNLKRLDFKPLKGNPCPPSDYECDAWADPPAWRIFAHHQGPTLILDDLGPGLH